MATQLDPILAAVAALQTEVAAVVALLPALAANAANGVDPAQVQAAADSITKATSDLTAAAAAVSPPA